MHSVDPAGAMYLPWELTGVGRTLAFQFTSAYVVLAFVIGLLSLQRERMPAAT
jgi:AGZA family xanthine/uracil permease-like MFS transporter